MNKPILFQDTKEEFLNSIKEEIHFYIVNQLHKVRSEEKIRIKNVSSELTSEIIVNFDEEVDRLLLSFERHAKCMVYRGIELIDKPYKKEV